MILRLEIMLRNKLLGMKMEPSDETRAASGFAYGNLSKAIRRAGQVFFVSYPCIKGLANQYHRHAPRPQRYIALQNVN